MTLLVRIPVACFDAAPSGPFGPHGVAATWRAETPHGVVWHSWSHKDYASALWGEGIPTVIIATASPGRGSGLSVRSHEVIPIRHGLRLVVGDTTGIINQPNSRFLFDPRDFTRRGRLVRARLGDATWTTRWWGVRTAAVERGGRRIAEFGKGAKRWAVDPAADPYDSAVALALLGSVSSAAMPLW